MHGSNDLNARGRGLEIFLKKQNERKEYPLLKINRLVFATNSGTTRECKHFCKRLVEIISEKRNVPYATAYKTPPRC